MQSQKRFPVFRAYKIHDSMRVHFFDGPRLQHGEACRIHLEQRTLLTHDLDAVRFRVDDRPQAQFACSKPLRREPALRDVAAYIGNPQRAAVDVVDAKGSDQHRDCRSVVDAAKIQLAGPTTVCNHRRYDFPGEPFMLPRVYKVGYRVPTRAFLEPYTQQLASDIVDEISSAIERCDADKFLTVTYQGRQLRVAAFGGDALLFKHP